MTSFVSVFMHHHYGDVIMGAIASQIISLTIVYSTVHSDADQRKHQSSASLAFVRGIHRGPVNSPHKWPVTRKMFPFDDVIMTRRPFYYHGIILILTWIGYHMPNKVWDEITYPFQNYNGATVKVWEWKSHFIPHFIMDVIIYPCQD